MVAQAAFVVAGPSLLALVLFSTSTLSKTPTPAGRKAAAAVCLANVQKCALFRSENRVQEWLTARKCQILGLLTLSGTSRRRSGIRKLNGGRSATVWRRRE